MATIALPWSLSLYVFLLLLATPWASAAVKNCSHLECFYNSRANVSCMWSHEEALNVTTCHVHAKSNLRHWNKTCELTLVRQASWACNLILGSFPESQSLTSVDLLDINVVCWEEKGWRRVKTCDFHPFDNLRLVAPHSLQVLHIDTQRCNISWKVSQVSDFIEPYLEFEARRRLLGHSWEDASVLSLKQRQQWLFLEMLIPSTSYEVQVRVKAQRNNTGTWSPWSQPLTFRTRPAGEPEAGWDPHMLLLLAVLIIVLVFMGLKIHLPWRLWKKIWAPVPTPESFFQPLYREHSGNFKKWVNTPFTASSIELVPQSSTTTSALHLSLYPAKEKKFPGLPGLEEQLECDGMSEPGHWCIIPLAAGQAVSAYSEERDRPYGLVSIDTVTVGDAEGLCVWPCSCEDDGYPAMNLDAGRESGPNSEDLLLVTDPAFLSCGCVSGSGLRLGGSPGSLLDRLRLSFAKEGDWTADPTWRTGSPGGGSESEAGSPPGLDMDTFDSGFAGSDCGSPVETDEGPPRSYLRQWVVRTPPPVDSGAQSS